MECMEKQVWTGNQVHISVRTGGRTRDSLVQSKIIYTAFTQREVLTCFGIQGCAAQMMDQFFTKNPQTRVPAQSRKSLEEGPISPKFTKIVKLPVFEAKTPQKWVPICEKFKPSNQPFLREENPWKWVGVSDLGLHTSSKK